MSIDTFAKRIRAVPCAAFSRREEAEAAKAREEDPEGGASSLAVSGCVQISPRDFESRVLGFYQNLPSGIQARET
jgi:hypothetical protein